MTQANIDKNQELDTLNDIEGEDNEISTNKDVLYPIDRDKINVTVNNWTIFTFKEYLKRKKIELQPVFQRSYVWNDEKAAGLIDSIWKWLPMPQVFLLTKKDWKSIVIDWQQRLTSIARFILSPEELEKYLPNFVAFTNSSRVQNIKLKVPAKIFDPHAKDSDEIDFDSLDETTRDKFEGESLVVAQINPAYSLFEWNENAIDDLSKEIFHRLNTGGIKLTPQEIRQGLYSWFFMQELQKISFSESWGKLLPFNIKKLDNDPSFSTEMLLRAFAFLDVFWDFAIENFSYTAPLETFLDNYAKISYTFSDEQVNNRLTLLVMAIEKLWSIPEFEHTLFRHTLETDSDGKTIRATFNIKYIDTLFVGVLNMLMYKPDTSVDEIKEKVLAFKNNKDYIETHILSSWWGDATYTSNRVKEWILLFKS